MVDFSGGAFSEDRYTWPATDDAGNNQIISAQVWVGEANGVINTRNLQ